MSTSLSSDFGVTAPGLPVSTRPPPTELRSAAAVNFRLLDIGNSTLSEAISSSGVSGASLKGASSLGLSKAAAPTTAALRRHAALLASFIRLGDNCLNAGSAFLMPALVPLAVFMPASSDLQDVEPDALDAAREIRAWAVAHAAGLSALVDEEVESRARLAIERAQKLVPAGKKQWGRL